jgi:hypothetical protein
MKKVTEREQVKIPCPEAVVNYIQNMGDADILDQILDYGLGWLSKRMVGISFSFCAKWIHC